MITGAQMRMARGHLRWSVKDLSDRCGVSSATIKRMEEVDHTPNSYSDNLASVQKALEAAGIIFIPENGGGAGVRLRHRSDGPSASKAKGPATDVVLEMDAAIKEHEAKKRK